MVRVTGESFTRCPVPTVPAGVRRLCHRTPAHCLRVALRSHPDRVLHPVRPQVGQQDRAHCHRHLCLLSPRPLRWRRLLRLKRCRQWRLRLRFR